ncbi:MAG: DUF1905 domain-containing protein [Actinomycetales bacterium]|nr:DUF1905 domain-containing protein [Actinomycetales bacterium]
MVLAGAVALPFRHRSPRCQRTDSRALVAAHLRLGVISVTAQIGETTWTTSLFPKVDGYALPLRAAVRSTQDVTLGDVVRVTMRLDVSL